MQTAAQQHSLRHTSPPRINGVRISFVFFGIHRKSRYVLSHTAAGGYQLVLVMTLVAGLGITGWMHDLDAFWGEDWPAEVHELLANALLTLA